MARDTHNALDHSQVQSASTGRYIGAFIVGFAITAIAAALATTAALSTATTVVVVCVLALAALTVQLYLLFKLDLTNSRIWHTVSMVMTIPLLIMAIALTAWMFHTLATRTTLPGIGM